MRLAFLSDIHGNLPALEAVWADLRREAPDRVYGGGDLVSFGPRPGEVVDFCRHNAIPTVLGNHDATVCGQADTGSYVFQNQAERDYIEQSMRRTLEDLSPHHIAYAAGLPREIQVPECSLVLTHSVPDLFAYPGPAALNEFMADRAERFLVLGHTHRPGLTPLEGGKLAINLPSVGKPKHGEPTAGYCLLEIQGEELAGLLFRFVKYDVQKVREEIVSRGYPKQSLRFLRREKE